MSRAAVVKRMTSGLPAAPSYFSYDAKLNRSRRLTLDRGLKGALKSLTLKQALRLRGAGAQLLDTRDPDAFAHGHLAGSINVGLGGKFATFAGIVLDRERPIVLIGEPGKEQESALRLGRIGLERNIKGFLRGGISALKGRSDLLSGFPRVSALQLRQLLAAPKPPLVLDVRNPGEREHSAIKRSLHIPLSQLPRRLKEVPAHGPVVVHCAGGYRSAIAASLLMASGRREISDLEGGIAAWEALEPEPKAILK